MHPPTFRVVSGEAGSIRNSKLVLLSSASVGFVVAKNQRIGSSYDVYKTTRHVFFHGRVPASLFNGSRFDSTFTPLPLPSLFLSAPTHSRARLEGERWPFVYRAIGSKMEEPLLGTKGRAPFQKIFFFLLFYFKASPPSIFPSRVEKTFAVFAGRQYREKYIPRFSKFRDFFAAVTKNMLEKNHQRLAAT